ncbi:MAG TPA: SHOCT domain-containing protein [Pseudonocardiaceae bacterium]
MVGVGLIFGPHILDERFARGEIDEQEYQQRRWRLGACGTPIDKKLSMLRRCATLGGDPLRDWRETAGSPAQPNIAGCRTSSQRDAETSSPAETIG